MADPYLGEIRLFGGNFAPDGWLPCNGQHVSMMKYDQLYNLIETTYGGDGMSTFGIPDLRGRVPIHQGINPKGGSYSVGQSGGLESVILTVGQMAKHVHVLQCAGAGTRGFDPIADGRVLAESLTAKLYHTAAPALPLSPKAVQTYGRSLPHENMQPFQCVNFIIAWRGIYPSQQ